jgi:dTDP-4-dehydrorhamnose reductase
VRVLIIGADTPVGLALCQFLEQRGRDYVGLVRADCRWNSERQAKKGLRRSECDFAVDIRLQSAADGGIKVHDVDIERCLWLARASQTLKMPLMHLSAARVFAGLEGRAYREDDYPDGRSSIAQLLIRAETALRDNCEQHVILRTGPVFSPVGINVVTHMLGQLHAGGTLSLSRRQSGCPLAAEDAARVISGMLDQFSCGLQAWGIYHYCSSDSTNCFEFAEVLLAAASQYEEFSGEVVQLAADEAEQVSRNLNCGKIKDTFAIKQQPWRATIVGHAKQYYSELDSRESGNVESYRQPDASA